MSNTLSHTMFGAVLFPETDPGEEEQSDRLNLQKVLLYHPDEQRPLREQPLVVFDFETTGLDSGADFIIEIGALRIEKDRIVDEFSSLIKPPTVLAEHITKITGITDAMLANEPTIEEQLPGFLRFIEGAILVAHNAEFDMAFLRSVCQREGYIITWPAFCTLKMARAILPDLESKNLDSLAGHYGFQFESRHRSIGDCKVTSSVLQSFLREEHVDINAWRDLKPFAVV